MGLGSETSWEEKIVLSKETIGFEPQKLPRGGCSSRREVLPPRGWVWNSQGMCAVDSDVVCVCVCVFRKVDVRLPEKGMKKGTQPPMAQGRFTKPSW